MIFPLRIQLCQTTISASIVTCRQSQWVHSSQAVHSSQFTPCSLPRRCHQCTCTAVCAVLQSTAADNRSWCAYIRTVPYTEIKITHPRGRVSVNTAVLLNLLSLFHVSWDGRLSSLGVLPSWIYSRSLQTQWNSGIRVVAYCCSAGVRLPAKGKATYNMM